MRDFEYDFLKDIHVVIHLASIANDPFGNLEPNSIYKPILDYSTKLAIECKKNNILFIWPSSCSVYGISDNVINEESEVFPQTAYSKNKVDFEKILFDLSDTNFRPVILRLSTLYGLSPECVLTL